MPITGINLNLDYDDSNYQGKGKLMKNYGWVQNTSNLSTVRDTVELIPISGCTHNELMRSIYLFRKSERSIRKKWTWDARCRIKAVCALGMAELDRENQGYILTDLGKRMLNAIKSDQLYKGKRKLSNEEIELFRKGLLTNPPVIRVMSLLNDSRKKYQRPLSKYDVGSSLGFAGDVGFTHYEAEYVATMGKSFNDVEGDADKWARTIISWLQQVDWVVKTDSVDIRGHMLQTYTTIYEVDRILQYTARSTIKYIPEEMLCSDHHPFSNIVQVRRKTILKALSRNNTLQVNELVASIIEDGVDTDAETVAFDVLNLMQAGINVIRERNNYRLLDNIRLDESTGTSMHGLGKVEGLEKEIEHMVTKYAETLPPRLVDNLIRYCNDGADNAALFEMNVDKFFTLLGYETEYLGQGRGRVADVIAKCKSSLYAKSYAVIIDAKAYAKYNFPAGDVRKMKEYINYHGPLLLQERIPNHSFAFISMDFLNPNDKLKEIADDTAISGTAITLYSLLELGAKVATRSIRIADLYDSFTNNLLYSL